MGLLDFYRKPVVVKKAPWYKKIFGAPDEIEMVADTQKIKWHLKILAALGAFLGFCMKAYRVAVLAPIEFFKTTFNGSELEQDGKE